MGSDHTLVFPEFTPLVIQHLRAVDLELLPIAELEEAAFLARSETRKMVSAMHQPETQVDCFMPRHWNSMNRRNNSRGSLTSDPDPRRPCGTCACLSGFWSLLS